MQNANTLEAMEVARQLILVLKGTVESLQMNLSQERDDNEGLKLTIESLEDENARLQEELFKVQAGAVEEKDTAKENQAEAIEAIAHGDESTSKVVGRAIGELKLPPGTTIGAVVRGDDVLIAHDTTIIQQDDHVVMFLVDKKHIQEVERLFQPSPFFL